MIFRMTSLAFTFGSVHAYIPSSLARLYATCTYVTPESSEYASEIVSCPGPDVVQPTVASSPPANESPLSGLVSITTGVVPVIVLEPPPPPPLPPHERIANHHVPSSGPVVRSVSAFDEAISAASSATEYVVLQLKSFECERVTTESDRLHAADQLVASGVAANSVPSAKTGSIASENVTDTDASVATPSAPSDGVTTRITGAAESEMDAAEIVASWFV